jgi:very-short-patch-repair endonuclease
MPREEKIIAEDEYLDAVEGLDPAIKTQSRLLRANMSSFETKIWKLVGKEDNPWNLLRQIPVQGYFLDFYSPEAMACVEADGPDHLKSVAHDADRDRALRKNGIRTLRITPADFRRARPMEILDMIGSFIETED